MTPKKFAKQFDDLVKNSKNICLTGHIQPDEDSISSVLAMFYYLKENYKEKSARMVYTGEKSPNLEWLPGFEKIEFMADMADHVNDFDTIIMLDGTQYHRFTYKPEIIEKFLGKKICIDHHSSPADKFDLSLHIHTSPSTAELIYLSFYKGKKIPKGLAEIFMLGILGDTGNFSYLKPHQTETLTTAKDLMEQSGMELQEFLSRYQTISKKVLEIIGEFIKNTRYQEIKGWPHFQTSFVSREIKDQKKYSDSEMSAASHVYLGNYLRMVEGHRWGILVYPSENGDCKISVRSLPGSVDAKNLMERMSLGGGHIRAAGGVYKAKNGEKLQSEDCLDEAIGWIKKEKPVLY